MASAAAAIPGLRVTVKDDVVTVFRDKDGRLDKITITFGKEGPKIETEEHPSSPVKK